MVETTEVHKIPPIITGTSIQWHEELDIYNKSVLKKLKTGQNKIPKTIIMYNYIINTVAYEEAII